MFLMTDSTSQEMASSTYRAQNKDEIKQQTDTVQEGFAKELKTFTDRVAEDTLLIQDLKAEINTLLQKMVDDINVLQQNAADKQMFQKELQELKTQLNFQMSLNLAHTTSLEMLTAELQLEVDKNKGLKEELDKIRDAYNEVSVQHNTTVTTAKNLAVTLHQEFTKERKTFIDRVGNDSDLIQNLMAEMDMLRQKTADEIDVLQLNEADKEMFFLKELQELKAMLEVQISLNLELKAELEAERKIARRQDELNQLCAEEESVPNVEVSVEVLDVETSLNLEFSNEVTVETGEDFPDTRTTVCKEQQDKWFEDQSVEKDDNKHKNDKCRKESSRPNSIPDLYPPEEVSADISPKKTSKKSVWKRVQQFFVFGKEQKGAPS
ncbi:hypothetical protein Q8A73_003151 [Channa argus]|nr:hypothetical protein Q8A73_003151 [Channa argus]